MPIFQRGWPGLVMWLDVLATALLLYILGGLWVYRRQVFTIGGSLGLVGLVMLVGFISIALFNIVSLVWLFQSVDKWSVLLIGMGILCLVLMASEKVMVDEVAHETVEGWSIRQEYIMLYGMLTIQLVYNVLVGRRVLRPAAHAV